MEASFYAPLMLLLCLVDLLTVTHAQCPPDDVSKVLRKIQKLEKRLFEQLTTAQQQQVSTRPGSFGSNQCSPGPQGPPGEPGKDGSPGPDGFPGDLGMKGRRGDPCIPRPPAYQRPIKGYQGDPGFKGRKGYKGTQGICQCQETQMPCQMCPYDGSGEKGDQGDPGDPGLLGRPGPPGEKGESAGVFDVPSHRGGGGGGGGMSFGTSWTNSRSHFPARRGYLIEP